MAILAKTRKWEGREKRERDDFRYTSTTLSSKKMPRVCLIKSNKKVNLGFISEVLVYENGIDIISNF
jgi:ribosomal protein S26